MKRQFFSHHYVSTFKPGEELLVPSMLHVYAIKWAATEPGTSSFELGGPAWKYGEERSKKVAKVHVTASGLGGTTTFWNVARRFSEEPLWLAVVREHARLLGSAHRVLTPDVIEANLVEHKNRCSAYDLLVHAVPFDSSGLQRDLLLEVDAGPTTVADLSFKLNVSAIKVQVAALRLWMDGLLDIPMRTQLLSSAWSLTRRSHGSV